MVIKAEDTNYQRRYIPMERPTRLLNMKDIVGSNPTKDLVVHKESDGSISIHPEEERMQGGQIIEHQNNSMLR